jgi:hypothetical protein
MMHERHHDSLVTTFGYTDSDISSEMLSASTANKTTIQAPRGIVVAPKAQPQAKAPEAKAPAAPAK